MGESTNLRATLRRPTCTVGVSRRYHHLSGLLACRELDDALGLYGDGE